MDDFTALSPADAYRRINFDRVEIRPGFVTDTYILVVTGLKPYENMAVELMPLVYVRQPDYWGIEVVGSLPGGIGLPTQASYTVGLPLDRFIGDKQEVVGKDDLALVEAIAQPCKTRLQLIHTVKSTTSNDRIGPFMTPPR